MRMASRLMQHNVLCARTFSPTCSQRRVVHTGRPPWKYVLCVCVWHCSNWGRVYIPRQSYTFLYLDDPSIHPSILIHRPTDLYIFTYLIPRLSFFPCITTEPTCSHNLNNRACLHTFLYLHMHLYQHTSLDLPTHTHLLTGLHAYHA